MWFLALRNKQFFLSTPNGSESTCDPDAVGLANVLIDAKWQGESIMCSSSIDFPEDSGLSPDFRADVVMKKAAQIAYATRAGRQVSITKTIETA